MKRKVAAGKVITKHNRELVLSMIESTTDISNVLCSPYSCFGKMSS